MNIADRFVIAAGITESTSVPFDCAQDKLAKQLNRITAAGNKNQILKLQIAYLRAMLKVGILGGGQLGRMLLQAAANYPVETHVLENDENCPAAYLCRYFKKETFAILMLFTILVKTLML